MPGIRVKNGPSQGQTFAVADEPLVIGRDPACTLSLQDKGASRRHAEIFRIGEMCFIRDLDSRNGSFVNDNRISEEMLRDGDRIQIGGTIMSFESGVSQNPAEALEFSEEELQDFYELRLEDLTSANVGEGDASSERHLRALYGLSRLAASEEGEDELIRKTLAFITDSLHADGAYIFCRDLQKGGIAAIGTHVPQGKKSGQLSRTIIRKVLQDKRALLITDAMRDDRFSSRESVLKHAIHAVICAPLATSGEAQGVLYIAGDDPSVAFNEQELELAAAMADQLGLALSNLRSRSRRREYTLSAVRLALKVGDAFNPGVAAQNEQLAAYMLSIGKAMRLKPADLENLQLAAFLHNYSELRAPAGTANADPGGSVQNTVDALSHEIFFKDLENIVRYQLERYDGSGPDRLSREEVPLGVRIYQVARALETRFNPSRGDGDPAALDAVTGEIQQESGKVYDPNVVAAMAQAHKGKALGLTLDEQWRADKLKQASSLLFDD